MQGNEEEKRCSELADIAFNCAGKCRICPFPGFNCAQHQKKKKKMTKPKKINEKPKTKKDVGESNVSGYQNKF